MSQHHAYPKTDANHDEIVNGLRARGLGVVSLASLGDGAPDILVGVPCGVTGDNVLIEIKVPGKALNAVQVKWHEEWPGPVYTAWTLKQALNICGLTP